jgi:hypothetical protein
MECWSVEVLEYPVTLSPRTLIQQQLQRLLHVTPGIVERV